MLQNIHKALQKYESYNGLFSGAILFFCFHFVFSWGEWSYKHNSRGIPEAKKGKFLVFSFPPYVGKP